MSFENVTIEQVRDYWDARPCNVRHSDLPVGSQEYFEEVRNRKYFVEPHIPGFADFDAWAGKKVLDVGCGIGTMAQSFAEAGALVTAVDLSPESIALAKQRMQVSGLEDRVRFFEADAERLTDSVPNDDYDLIFSFGVLHHTPRPNIAFAQLRALAQSGTRLKVMLYHRGSTKAVALTARYGALRPWRIDEAVAKQSEAEFGCPVTYTYSRRGAAELIERSGFVVDHVFVDHIFPYDVDRYRERDFVKRRYWRMLPDNIFRTAERAFGWHLLVDGHVR